MGTSGPHSDEFDREYKLAGLFIENAKTYLQLSTGALVLSVTFLHEILGVPQGQKVPTDWLLMLSWIFFLAAILAGASFQYFASKFIEWKSGVARHHRSWPEQLVRHPWLMYGVMLITFYLGAITFTAAAIRRL
jgi:hypothetical protein